MLPQGCWETLYSVTYPLHENLAECLQSVGEVNEAENYFNLCLQYGKTVEEKVIIYIKLMQVSNQLGAFENSYKYAKNAFQLLNFPFNFNPSLLKSFLGF